MAFDPNKDMNEGAKGQPRPFGRFYLHELINSGGMADIWVATDAQGQTYALRRMHDKFRFNFIARGRFTRGCEILASLPPHEGIVRYLDHGKMESTLYLLMEYVESSNLKLLQARNDPLFSENIANILIDMSVALEHMHDNHVMHLDFKPENVIMTRSGAIRLVDFDLCQPIPEKPKKTSRNPGTPHYMAPEQLQRKPMDHRADIFAFGVTAYELLTYQKPFPGETPDEVLRRQLARTDSFIAPRELNPDIPATLEKVILRCLDNDPDKRYPIMSSVVHELKSALYVS
ncbi:MAG: serine/threonine-protein kinase [Verrucomicrobiota bacterium]